MSHKLFKAPAAAVFAFILVSMVVPSRGLCDSWAEKPDVDFYAHPLFENYEHPSVYRLGKVAEKPEKNMKASGAVYVNVGGRKYTADVFKPDMILKKGGSVLCAVEGSGVSVVDYNRIPVIIILAALFTTGVLLVNFRKGLRALAALFISILVLGLLFLPAVRAGFNPQVAGFVTCVLISFITMFIVSADRKKALPAALGASTGILSSLVFARLFMYAMHTGGFSSQPLQMLNYFIRNYKSGIAGAEGVFFAGIMVGAAGVVMDVAISISSSIRAIKEERPQATRNSLFASGMNIGRDIIASMANTLLFAYAGGAFFVIVGRSYFHYSFTGLMNAEWFAVMLAEILAGTVAIIITVPATSFLAAEIVER